MEGKKVIFLPEDRRICEELLRSAYDRGDDAIPLSELIVAVGRNFIGAPYEAETLEREGDEELVVNLRAFDCITFVENAVVLAGMIRAGKTGFADFASALESIRYRGGRRDGYPSRLHYFTDWLRDNGRRGIVRDITAGIGGRPFRKQFHALTDRREEHPALKDATAFGRMRIVEAACSRRTQCHIAKADLNRAAEGIADGDIIAITTDEKGLDVSHAGLAVHDRGQLHLLHASSAAGKVVLSDTTLDRYLLSRRTRTGIIVGRAEDPSGLRPPRRRRRPPGRSPGRAPDPARDSPSPSG
jgi:hypothetical protein